MNSTLSLTEEQHKLLKTHLFTEDGFESAAVLLCGQHRSNQYLRLCVYAVHPIPDRFYSVRNAYKIVWDTEAIAPFIEQAVNESWAIIKIHSHVAASS